MKINRTSLLRPVLVVLAALLSFTASAQAERLKVVTTFTVIADMARNVAGDAADVVSITKPGAEIHNYQPTPGDLRRALDADLILWNGLNLELWFEKFLKRLRGVPGVVVSEGIDPLPISSGPYSGRPNPHAWIGASDTLIYVENIRNALSEADPENAETYAANAAAYSAEINATMAPLRAKMASVPEDRRWLVTSEGAFSYMARDFGLKELFIWPINADAQGTPAQVRNVIDTVRANGIPVVFSESTVSAEPAKTIARETGARYGGVLYVDSLSGPDGPVPTYLDLLRITATTIAEGLTD